MSPKNKGKFGKAKTTAVPETDEFISGIDRLARALKPHALRLGVFFGVVAVIVVSYATWHWWQQRKLTAATELYGHAVALGHVPLAAEGGEDTPEDPKKKPPPDPRGLPSEFATAADRSRAMLASLEELSADYGGTPVAQQGLLMQGETLYRLGRHDDAIARYREYLDGGGPDELMLSAREGIAYSLEAKAVAQKDAKARQAGLERLLEAFQEMQPQGEGPRRDEALYHQGRMQAALGRKDEARKTLEQILVQHQGSNLKRDVEMRLTALSAPAK